MLLVRRALERPRPEKAPPAHVAQSAPAANNFSHYWRAVAERNHIGAANRSVNVWPEIE